MNLSKVTFRKFFSFGKIGESQVLRSCKESFKCRSLSTTDSCLINRTNALTTFNTKINEGALFLGSKEEKQMKICDFDIELINHLERNSLVDFDSEEAISRLQEAISFASTLEEVETDGVEPMTSTLENISLSLRIDKVDTTNRSDILINASVTEEDYFVAPPGNIPLDPQRKL